MDNFGTTKVPPVRERTLVKARVNVRWGDLGWIRAVDDLEAGHVVAGHLEGRSLLQESAPREPLDDRPAGDVDSRPVQRSALNLPGPYQPVRPTGAPGTRSGFSRRGCYPRPLSVGCHAWPFRGRRLPVVVKCTIGDRDGAVQLPLQLQAASGPLRPTHGPATSRVDSTARPGILRKSASRVHTGASRSNASAT